MADPDPQQPIVAPTDAGKPKKFVWPKEFNRSAQPPGMEVKIDADTWKVIHGGTPLAAYAARGKRPPDVDKEKVNDLGHMGEILHFEKGCPRCAALTYVVIPADGAKCVGCGTLLQ